MSSNDTLQIERERPALEEPAQPEPPRGVASRRLFVGLGIALAALMLFLMGRELSANAARERAVEEARQAVVAKKASDEAGTPPAPAAFDEIKDQAERERAKPTPAPFSEPRQATVPIVAPAPIGVPGTSGREQPSQEMADEAARRASPLMAGGVRRNSAPQSTTVGALGPAAPDMSNQLGAIEAALRAGSSQNAPAPVATPVRAEADRAFVRQTAAESAAEHARANLATSVVNKLMLRQGETIICANRERINTDLPGQLTCDVVADVYDSLTGRCVLVPRGSWMLARYSADIRPGQERVLVAFTRLLRRDGMSIDLSGSGGIDSSGQAGWGGEVNNHFFRMFTASFVVAALAYGVDRTTRSNGGVTVNTGTNPTTAAGQVLSDVSRTILERNRYIPPTITIEQAQRFHASVARDLVLPPVSCP